jgi:hypothetical protein|tara:strand:+ start:189 stop:347 length:159 start_codon:yes stop_codon:yes gene_type:complete
MTVNHVTYDKEFKEFMLSAFSTKEKYDEVMRQWAANTCKPNPCSIVDGECNV